MRQAKKAAITVRLDAAMRKDLDRLAVELKCSVGDLIREAVANRLARFERAGK